MFNKPFFVRSLSAAFLVGGWSLEGLVDSGALVCGRRERWLRPLARHLIAAFGDNPSGITPTALAKFISEDKSFMKGWTNRCSTGHFVFRPVLETVPHMTPASGLPATWPVPALTTPAALAEWLGLSIPELDWFADSHKRQARLPVGPLRHYTYQWLIAPSGKARLLEKPKQRLKAIQRRILHEILDLVPPHDAVHGYRRGRSVITSIAAHVGRRIVLHFDLRDFFPSVRRSRVHALFAALGYPYPVARLLTGLCTNTVPDDVLQSAPPRESGMTALRNPLLFRGAHLPQGAPTSPALANLSANGLDRRLAALGGTIDANYTRYADDLTFSGDERLERGARRFQVQVCVIALEEGFEVQTRKTRFMRQGVRQQVAGIVLNVRPNICRKEYDRLKAILYNCIRLGPESQNRDERSDFRSYLSGRIGYVATLNPNRVKRLCALFDRIAWTSDA